MLHNRLYRVKQMARSRHLIHAQSFIDETLQSIFILFFDFLVIVGATSGIGLAYAEEVCMYLCIWTLKSTSINKTLSSVPIATFVYLTSLFRTL